MRLCQTILALLFIFSAGFTAPAQMRCLVHFDPAAPETVPLLKAGIIDPAGASRGWMLERDYQRYSERLRLQVLKREPATFRRPAAAGIADSIGQVLEIYPLPPAVDAAIGLGYHGGYFYLSDFSYNNEVIYKLDPQNNFAVVNTFPAPALSTLYCWGVASDGTNLYIANPLEDRIFKTDTSGTPLANYYISGELPSGLGYRHGILWNADLGDAFSYPPVPPKLIKTDTSGIFQGSYILANTTNGVAAHDSAIFISHNKTNGKNIEAYDPDTFTLLFSVPSPLDFPNGLAFDGRYLWISGKDQNQNWMVKMDVGVQQQQPPELDWQNFTLVQDGKFNNRFNAAYDSQGNAHIVYATQVETVSETKEIMYATNASGIWELTQITHDDLSDELPEIAVDSSDVVHLMWNGYWPAEGDIEIFYTNNSSGTFAPKQMITRKSADGIDGHAYPHFAIDDTGIIHFTFTSLPQISTAEIYYAELAVYGGNATMPQNVSNNSYGDYDPKILLDQLGTVHIFWCFWGSDLYHAENSGGSWTQENIADMGWNRPAIGIDPQGTIHFAVTKSGVVSYGNNLSGSFAVTDTVAVHAAGCFYPEMAVTPSGQVHLTYHAFGDSLNTWPGNGEIFYTNKSLWEAGNFPANISRHPAEQDIYPGMAALDDTTLMVGWAHMGSTEAIFSDIRLALTRPDSAGYLSGKINLSGSFHDFGFIPHADTAGWRFTIRNSGVRPLTVTDMYWDSGMSPDNPHFLVTPDFSGPQTLNQGDSLLVNLVAEMSVPVRGDTVSLEGWLTVSSDDPLNPETVVTLQAQSEPLGLEPAQAAVIHRNELLPNYPNPFNPVTTIHYSLAKRQKATLQVFNVNGQLVRTLADEMRAAGRHQAVWDGRNGDGKLLGSGVYFYRLKIGERFVETRRMLLLK